MNDFIYEALDEAELRQNLPEDKLQALTSLCERMEELQEHAAQAAEHAKQAKKNAELVGSKMIPELMEELGVERVTLKDGREVKLTYAWYGRVTTDKAYQWLQDNGLEDIIKHTCAVSVPKNENPTEIEQIAAEYGWDCKTTFKVEPQTLRALLTEDMKSGDPRIPHDLFQVYTAHKTVIK